MTDEKKISELTADELAAYANDALAAKNRELLTEVKKFKASAAGLRTELETAQSELEAAKSELLDIKLNTPVRAMLKELFELPEKLTRKITEEYVRFELDGDNIVVRDTDGKPLMIKPSEKEAEREAAFDVKDLKYILSQTGELDSVLIGSRASGPSTHRGPVTTIPLKETSVSSQLGIK